MTKFRTGLVFVALMLPLAANAGVVRFTAKQGYHASKKAVHYSVKAGKVAGKVLF